jgi:hypothetical protein
MNAQLRKNTIPRISRKVADSVVRKINTVFGEQVVYLIKTCNKCKEPQSVHNFYVKKHKQQIEESELKSNDFRNICIVCHDTASFRNRRTRRAKSKVLFDIFQLENNNG